MKGSADVEAFSPAALAFYAHWCGWTLARAHARSETRSRSLLTLARATVRQVRRRLRRALRRSKRAGLQGFHRTQSAQDDWRRSRASDAQSGSEDRPTGGGRLSSAAQDLPTAAGRRLDGSRWARVAGIYVPIGRQESLSRACLRPPPRKAELVKDRVDVLFHCSFAQHECLGDCVVALALSYLGEDLALPRSKGRQGRPFRAPLRGDEQVHDPRVDDGAAICDASRAQRGALRDRVRGP